MVRANSGLCCWGKEVSRRWVGSDSYFAGWGSGCEEFLVEHVGEDLVAMGVVEGAVADGGQHEGQGARVAFFAEGVGGSELVGAVEDVGLAAAVGG